MVFLRQVDPERARPWTWDPVRVEQVDCEIQLTQGQTRTDVGFVKRGDYVDMVSRDPWFHSLHAAGASYFTLAFPDANRPIRKRLTRSGPIELSSAAGYYWMRAHLFVSDHPYITRSDAQGRFQLSQVPCGNYEIVAWLPNWEIERQARDQEMGQVYRLHFARPLEVARPLGVAEKDQTGVELMLSSSHLTRSRGDAE